MDKIALVLRSYLEDDHLSQRRLAEILHVSLGTANKLVAECIQRGFLEPVSTIYNKTRRYAHEDYRLSDTGKSYLAPSRVDGAVIFAAGFGSRFVPLTFETPKGLVEVFGERMIERQIRQLHEAGITDITIVVGYLKEKFEYLIDKFGVKLLYNPEYRDKNTLATFYHARELFRGKNMYLLVSDNWLRNNMYHAYEPGSWYSAVYMKGETSEWCLDINKKGRITGVQIGGRDSWVMYGPIYMDRAFSEKFIPLLEEEYQMPGTEQNYWEYTLMHHIGELEMDANFQPENQVYEFENLEELRAFDPRYQNHSDNKALELVSEVFKIPEAKIINIRCLKSGMTNRSFLFEVEGSHYICRIPGEGTDKLINRAEEAAVYRAVAPLKITETILYFDEHTGYKISRYYEGAQNADFHDPCSETVEKCMALLRTLHGSGITVGHKFDIGERIDFYEELCRGMEMQLFEDYREVRAHADQLLRALARLEAPGWTSSRAVPETPEGPHHRQMVLSHIDPVKDNFLLLPDGRVKLIDWEYAGMQDPLIDIGMSSIYTYYSAAETDQLLKTYLKREPTDEERFVTFAFAALGAFLWALWAVYKSMAGIEFGDYTIIMYRYMKEYYRKLERELPGFLA